MRAKYVFKNKCVVFDFDDTIVQTDAKVHIIKDGRKIRSLSASEHKSYELKPGESEDYSDLADPRLLMAGRKYKMWPELKRVSDSIKMGNNYGLYILTARSPKSKYPIYNYLKREGIEIDENNIICVGNDDGININTANEKKEVLMSLSDDFDNIVFYDDSEKNIQYANKVPGIRTRLIEEDI